MWTCVETPASQAHFLPDGEAAGFRRGRLALKSQGRARMAFRSWPVNILPRELGSSTSYWEQWPGKASDGDSSGMIYSGLPQLV